MSGSPLLTMNTSNTEQSIACNCSAICASMSESESISSGDSEDQVSSDERESNCTPQISPYPVELFAVKPFEDDFAHECAPRMSWVDDPDDEYYVADDPNFYVDIADKLGDDLEAHTIMALHCQDTQLAHKVVMYYSNNSTVTLPFDLEDASNAKSDGCGSCVSELRNHILACAETSCPISAYVYYLGFLEQVFRKIAKTLHWLKGETGSVNHAVRSWRTEMEGCGSRNELHRAIIGAHSSAIYEDRREFPELAGSDVNIEVAENAAYQAYRRLGAVLPLYLRYSRRRNIPVLTLAFHGADVLARTSVKVAPRHTLQGESIPDDSRTSYTLFDILCSSIRVLTEDGLRALFIFNDVGCLRMQPEDDSTPSRYALSWSYGPGVSSKDMRAIRVQAIRERGRSIALDVPGDVFGAVLPQQERLMTSRPSTPPSSQTSMESASESSASETLITPPDIIALSVQANKKAASIRRTIGNEGVVRAAKRIKVDVISATVPRLKRRMQTRRRGNTSVSPVCSRKEYSIGGSKPLSSIAVATHLDETLCDVLYTSGEYASGEKVVANKKMLSV